MGFENTGWADFETLQNVNECFKLLKKGLECLENDKYEDALSALSDASTLMYINLNRTINYSINSKHLWGIIVQFNLLAISLMLSYLVRTKQDRGEARESLGGATALLAFITGFLNPLIRSFMEQEARVNGFRLSEKDRSLLGDIIQLNETVREFKKQFEEVKKINTEAKPKKTSRKRKAYQ